LSIEKKVLFVPPVVDAAPLYGVFDIYAMSSITEQMPMALLEAMSSGLPVICTAAGDTAHIVQAEPALQVHAIEDEGGYREALIQLGTSGALRTRLGASNRERCVSAFSLDAMVKGYRDVYLSAMRRPH